jgi:hypothetical protein
MRSAIIGRRSTLFVAIIMLLSIQFAGLPLASEEEKSFTNHEFSTICNTILTPGGECDELNPATDLTPTSKEWIEGDYTFDMISTSQIGLSMEWAMYEFNDSKVGGLGSLFPNLPSTAEDLFTQNGLPADYLRNFFGVDMGQAMTVDEMILNQTESAVSDMLNSGFGDIASLNVEYLERGSKGTSDHCLQDGSFDSSSEGAYADDPYNPPICISISAVIDLSTSKFQLADSAELDLERSYQGLLTMGSEISTPFTLFAMVGHQNTFEIEPPSYATINGVTGQGGSTPSRSDGQYSYNIGRWTIDNREASNTDPTLERNVTLTIGRRTTATIPVVIDTVNDTAVDISVVLDMSNEDAATLDVDIQLNYIDSDIMAEWGINMVDNSSGATIPWVTADGIRMAEANGLVAMDNFTDNFPVDAIAEGISAIVGEGKVTMDSPSWRNISGVGGLGFHHIAGSTCGEADPPSDDHDRYCITGQNAMSDTYPVLLESSSNTFQFSLLDMAKSYIDLNDTGFDLEVITNSDLQTVLNAGLSIETDMGDGFVSDMIPDNLPPTRVEVKLILPDWVSTPDGTGEVIFSKSSAVLGITGTNPYDWRNPIKEGDTTVCAANQQTCASFEVELDISSFALHEWSQKAEMEFSGGATFKLYRLGLPDVARDMLATEDATLDMPVVPADLVRLIIDIGGRLDEPYNTTVPLMDDELYLVFTRQGIQNFASELGTTLTDTIHQAGRDMKSETGQDIDFSQIEVVTSVSNLEPPSSTSVGDTKPIEISIEIKATTLTVAWEGESDFSLTTTSIDSPLMPFFNTFADLLRGNSLMNAAGSDGSGYVVTDPETGGPFELEMEGADLGEDMGDIMPAITLILGLPAGLSFGTFESANGGSSTTEVDGRQQVTYTMPKAGETDTLSITFVIGWAFLLQEAWGYGAVSLLGIGLLWRRRKRKRSLKLDKLENEFTNKNKTRVSERQFAAMGGWGDDAADGAPPAPGSGFGGNAGGDDFFGDASWNS